MGKPGVMLYFDVIPALEQMTDGARGKLLLAFLRYARDGEEPNPPLRGTASIAWSFLQCSADRDDENYRKKVENARRSTEKREARRKRLDAILTEGSVGAGGPGGRGRTFAYACVKSVTNYNYNTTTTPTPTPTPTPTTKATAKTIPVSIPIPLHPTINPKKINQLQLPLINLQSSISQQSQAKLSRLLGDWR